MKKGLLLLVAGVMAFGVAVQSLASARINSMSTDPRLIEDYDLIWLYPNKVLEYKGTADFRLNAGPFSGGGPGGSLNGSFGGGQNEWGGLLVDATDLGGVLGIYVNRPSRLYTSAHSAVAGHSTGFPVMARYYWYYPGANNFAPRNIVDVFYGTGLEGADLGIHVNYGDNGISAGGVEQMVLGLGVGLGFKDFGPFNEGNIHASYDMMSATFKFFPEPNGDNGISTIKVGGLFSADAGNDTAIRLSADFQLDNWNVEDTFGTQRNAINALIGLACNHKVNGGKGLVSSGLLINWMGGTDSSSGTDLARNAWVVLWNGSIEASVTNWLTLRAGIQRALVARVYSEPGVYADTNGWPNVQFNTGIGVTWNNFQLDGVINMTSLENWLSSPNAGAGIFYPGTTGGTGQGIVALSEIDLKYKF